MADYTGSITLTDTSTLPIPERNYFWFLTAADATTDYGAGTYITEIPIDTFKTQKAGGYVYINNGGLDIGVGNTVYTELTTSGLKVKKGGVVGGTAGSNGYVYLSTDAHTGTSINIGGNSSDWRLIVGTKFGVTGNGVLYATNANISGTVNASSGSFSGTITASSGMIGGFHISSSANTAAYTGHAYTNSLYRHSGDGTYDYEVGIKGDGGEPSSSSSGSGSGNLAFYITRVSHGQAWTTDNRTNLFYVTHAGTLYAANATIKGTITATGGKVGNLNVTSVSLYTSNHSSWDANVNGIFINDTIISFGKQAITYFKNDGTGKIGPWHITSTSIYKGSATYGASGTGNMYFGNSGLSISNTFKVSNAGVLTATGATINGTITATGGTIGGCNITNGVLQIAAANITSGTFDTARIPSLAISKITNLSSELTSAKNTANSYIYYSAGTGLKLAQSNPSSATTNYIQITSSGIKTVGNNASYYTNINASGMQVYAGDTSNYVANFGTSVALGKLSSSTIWNTRATNGQETRLTIDAEGIKIRANSKYGSAVETNKLVFSITYDYVGPGMSFYSPYSFIFNKTIYATGGFQTEQAVKAEGIIRGGGYISSETGFYTTVAPGAYSQTYNTIWYKNSSNNYILTRPSSSSIRYKENIKNVVNKELDPHNLYNIKVQQFKFKENYFAKDDPYNKNRYDVIGLIAEDVKKHYPVAAVEVDGQVENWDARYIIPPMLALIQEQHKEIEELKQLIKGGIK